MAYIVSKRMHDAVLEVGVDAEGKTRILNANMQASLLTGYSEEALKKMDAFELFTPDSVKNLTEEREFDPEIDLAELFRRFPKQTLRSAHGKDVPMEMKIFSLPPSKGHAENYEIIFRDKTLVHHLSDRLRENAAGANAAEAFDKATDLYTGAVAEDALATICRYAGERPETPITLALVYVDFDNDADVKKGDRDNVLAAVGADMRNYIRYEDVIFYFRRDMLENCGAHAAAAECKEGVFCVALINCDLVQAHRCMERTRRGLAESETIRNVCYPLGGSVRVSVGCASAAFDPEESFFASRMLEGAGDALCAALRMGGGRVALASNGEVLLRYAAEAEGKPIPMKKPRGFFRRFARK
ncbi:MAG: PAS domain S-box protein [Rickettsiales bacterium]